MATALLFAALALSALAILYWSRGSSFYADDWNFIVDRRPWTLHTLLLPSNGHLLLLPLLVFKTELAIFGAGSALPFRLTVVALVLLDGALVYLLARPRIGAAALIPAVLMVFLGAGWEMIISSFALSPLLSTAAGLGMLLCLDRRDLAGDAGACALLILSLASFSLGIVFGLIAALELFLGRGRRLEAAWVYLVPALLYGAWLIWASQFHENQLAATNIGSGPTAIADGAAAASAAIFGVFRYPGTANPAAPDLGIRTDWGIPIALALGAALVLRLRGVPRPSPRAWALLIAIAVYWGLLALSIGPARSPLASRYVYPGVLLVLLLAVELVAGLRISQGWWLAAVAALAVSLVGNVDSIRVAGGYFRAESSYNRAELAALELARGRVSPDFIVEEGSTALLPHGDMIFTAGNYFDAVDDFGSPAYSPAQLAGAGAPQRAAADQELGRALGIGAVPVDRFQGRVVHGSVKLGRAAVNMAAERQGRCVFLRPATGYEGRATLLLPAGGFRYAPTRDIQVQVGLGRFGNGFAVNPAPVLGQAEMKIPRDASNRPWRALVRSTVPVVACPA